MHARFIAVLGFAISLATAGATLEQPVSASGGTPLWEQGAPDAKPGDDGKDPAIVKFMPEHPNGTAIIVCPGGGYRGLALKHEGDQVAAWLNDNGIAAFVLRYRHAPEYQHPAPRNDIRRAVRLVRHNAAAWGLRADRIGVLGFSAGGHLTATAATQFDAGDPKAADPIDRESSRPDFAAPIYALITMRESWGHAGTREALLGKDATDALMAEMSMETQVKPDTPPVFIAATTADTAVLPKNATAFYEACLTAGVPVEMHLFEKGRHGLGLGIEEIPFKQWPGLFIAWLKDHGFLESP